MTLTPITEIYSLGVYGAAGFQAAIDTTLKDDPVMMLSIQLQQNQHITLGFDEQRLRELSSKLANLADILVTRTKPDADKTPTAAQVVREGATFFSSTGTT